MRQIVRRAMGIPTYARKDIQLNYRLKAIFGAGGLTFSVRNGCELLRKLLETVPGVRCLPLSEMIASKISIQTLLYFHELLY